jgi:hypothetical protein
MSVFENSVLIIILFCSQDLHLAMPPQDIEHIYCINLNSHRDVIIKYSISITTRIITYVINIYLDQREMK